MNLFLYSREDEFMTQVLLENLSRKPSWLCLDIREFVTHARLREEITQSHCRRGWTYQDRSLLDGEQALVLDRVFSFQNSASLFKHPEFGMTEWDALFFYLRNSSKRHVGTLFHEEPLSWSLPLPKQWASLAAENFGVCTPNMEYPYREADTALEPSRAVIVSFNERYQWRPGRHTTSDRALAFERPPGRPVSILATPNGFLSAPDSPTSNEKLGRLAMNICRRWKIWFSEILFFDDGDQIYFGMVNVQPSKIYDRDTLADFIDSQIQELIA
jgi:hypothetical protein